MTHRWTISILLFFFFCFLFVHNLSHSVYGGDVGDLVTSAFVGGVPHAPGYPLFTLLGFLLTRFSFWPTPAYAVGMISALSGAMGIVVFFLFINRLVKNTLVSFVTTLILGFSYLFWFYNEIAEVFSLNTFFALLLFSLAVSVYQRQKVKTLFLLSFFLGLALSHHQTIVLIYPSIFLLIIAGFWNKKKQLLKLIPFLLLTSCVGFLPYIYVFIATAHDPVIIWDKVTDWNSFLHLILRKDYGTFSGGVFLPPTLAQRLVILQTYAFSLLTQLTIPVIVTSCVGLISLWKKHKILSISFLSAFLFSGPLFIGYVGFPLYGAFYVGIYERFFILSSVIVLFFFPFGLLTFSGFFAKLLKRNLWKTAIPLVFCIIPLSLFIYNFPKTDLSHVMIGDTIGKDFIVPLPRNAVIFMNGDTTIFNTWYVHYALHIRRDIQIVNLDGLYRDTFFLSQLRQYEKVHGPLPTTRLMGTIVRQIQIKRPVFSLSALPIGKGEKKFQWVPYGITLRLLQDNEKVPQEAVFTKEEERVWNEIHVPLPTNDESFGNLSIADIPTVYLNSMVAVGNYYLLQYKDAVRAKEWYDKALGVNADNAGVHQVLAIYYYTAMRNCPVAAKEFRHTLVLDPLDRLSYFLLHKVYTDCLHDIPARRQLEKAFKTEFHESYQEAFTKTMKAK